jgi:hypothetical protein
MAPLASRLFYNRKAYVELMKDYPLTSHFHPNRERIKKEVADILMLGKNFYAEARTAEKKYVFTVSHPH